MILWLVRFTKLEQYNTPQKVLSKGGTKWKYYFGSTVLLTIIIAVKMQDLMVDLNIPTINNAEHLNKVQSKAKVKRNCHSSCTELLFMRTSAVRKYDIMVSQIYHILPIQNTTKGCLANGK